MRSFKWSGLCEKSFRSTAGQGPQLPRKGDLYFLHLSPLAGDAILCHSFSFCTNHLGGRLIDTVSWPFLIPWNGHQLPESIKVESGFEKSIE